MNTENENVKKGGISVETNHIFPIIKKWLYSDKDIFLREIVSNATDAVTKLRRLSSLGQYDANDEKYSVRVTVDKDAKTLTVSDNGIGMTEEELEKYICSIALSGALDFVQKYEDGSTSNGIIGHFGLGFYSSFMVSDTVEILTKSYTGEKAVHWSCNGMGEYEIEEGEREEHGTDIIMHISDEEQEYLEEYRIRSILDKYCSFMSVDIFLHNEKSNDADKDNADSADEEDKPINDTQPLWQKNAGDCSEDEYKEFYKKVFNDYKDPLFYIHINADYPLNFKGILYFPKRANDYESFEGQVKLFYNQVFVADDIKEIIPEYLLMLKGVLDCPELPLNVSRSYLQDNTYVKKLSAHIVKKVADKLCSMCNNEREKYETLWKDLKLFIEYASLRDRKFYDRIKPCYLLELSDGKYMTVTDYLAECENTHKGTIYYATDKALQAQYISMFEAERVKVAIFDHQLDVQFMGMCESIDSDVKYKRIDSDVSEMISDGENAESNEELVKLFREASGNDKLEVVFKPLKDDKVPALITLSEESRRMDDMMKMYSGMGMDMGMGQYPVEYTFTVNTSSPLISRLCEINADDADKAKLMASEIYKLSVIAQRKMTSDELKDFLSDSFSVLGLL